MAAGTTHARTTIPTVPPRPHQSIRLQRARRRKARGRGEEEICRGSHNAPRLTGPLEQVDPLMVIRGGSPADWASQQCLEDLKEKKLVEDKENGKDAATNGKEKEENGEPDVDDEEEDEVDEEDEEDDGEGDEEDEDDDEDDVEGGTKRAADDDDEDDEDDVETKKQKTDDDD